MAHPPAPDKPNAKPDPIDERLYCPKCSYNLTGVVESRCPECGQIFNHQTLRRLREYHPKPISDFSFFVQFLLLPLPAMFFPVLVSIFDPRGRYGLFFGAYLAAVVFVAPAVAYRLAQRLYARRLVVWRLRFNPRDRARYVRSRALGMLALWLVMFSPGCLLALPLSCR